jgi:hypothetical protein
MTYILQHFSQHPVLYLECPLPLDFYRGIDAAQCYLRELFKNPKAPNQVSWVIHLHELYPSHFDLFVRFLTQRTVYGEALIYHPHIQTIIVGEPNLTEMVNEFFYERSIPRLDIPTFNSVDEAFYFCTKDFEALPLL